MLIARVTIGQFKINIVMTVITAMKIVSLPMNLLCGGIVSISGTEINDRAGAMRGVAKLSSGVVTMNNAVKKETNSDSFAWAAALMR